ncbi:MAG: pilin [Patescibacteria group bacterium]
MMRVLTFLLTLSTALFFAPTIHAQTTSPQLLDFTSSTLQIITLIASAAVVLLLIKAGYEYMTSAGKPEVLESAKKTIRNALIGLVLVLTANIVISVFQQSLTSSSEMSTTTYLEFAPIEADEPSDGLTQVLIDAVTAFMQNIVESATAPLVEGIIKYLTLTPTLLGNSVIFDFWLVSLGIVNTLFVIVVALLGLQLMSATTFGFDEVQLKQLLPRIGLGFLGANTSLFLADYVIITSNALVTAVLESTGGLNHAWVVTAVSPASLISGGTPLITLIFLILFVIVAIVLLLLYISRLILISLGAVIAPFIFLLWTIPKTADYAEIATKTYFVTVFMVFVHVVIIQLASSFLALPEHSENSLLAIAIAIGLFFTLLKTPSLMMQMAYYTSSNGTVKKMGNQIMNVVSTNTSSGGRVSVVKKPRKVIRA